MMDDVTQSPHFLAGRSGKVGLFPAPADIVRERSVMVPMRDGIRLAANVFRPATPGRHPVIMSTSPYGKDGSDQAQRNEHIPDFHSGDYSASDLTAFEAPDPAYWVSHGYVVVHADTRGQGESEGASAPFLPDARLDYFDLIEWAAAQPWSDGNIGLCGVSYLAISQWGVAPLCPPHLKAIMPWEGFNDNYDFLYFGGIPERGMSTLLKAAWFDPVRNPKADVDPRDLVEERLRHPLRDEFWEAQAVDLESVTIPAFVCGSFSDQGLHTPDSFHGFRRLGSREKWLYTHRRLKWSAFYGEQDLQRRFFDRFLKGIDSGIEDQPPVHLEIYENRLEYKVRSARSWPLENTDYQEFHLDAASGLMARSPSTTEANTSYLSDGTDRATFELRFDRDIDIVGHGKLRVWVSADEADDIDLFVAIQKLDLNGDQIFFFGQTGSNANDAVARGWLRASHRELDTARSEPWLPVLAHRTEQKLAGGEIVACDIELLPSATTFRAGERLRLVVQGATILPGAPWVDFDTINKGRTVIHTGGQYDSHLLLPIVDLD